MTMAEANLNSESKKHVKTNEFVLYLLGVFFYTTMTGMVGGNRNAYLVNVLRSSVPLPAQQAYGL